MNDKIRKNIIMLPFVLMLIILLILFPDQIKNIKSDVDWTTITALTGLLLITTGIKESNLFDRIIKRLLTKPGTERSIALMFIITSAVLSMFLTNDIALLIVIPLTLELQEYVKNNVNKILVFEAIAVNVGSFLTPIGNPQNLYLWHKWGISFISFVSKTIGIFAILMLILLIFAIVSFSNKKLELRFKTSKRLKRGLSITSLILLITYVLAMQTNYLLICFIIVIITFTIFFNRIMIKTDWSLIILFIIMFIDFNIVTRINLIRSFLSSISWNLKNTIIASFLTSQIISNVPASILISNYSKNWLGIVIGANIGASATAISSFANMIMLKMTKKTFLQFHKYAIAFTLISLIVILLIM